jgi:hypothetical protein
MALFYPTFRIPKSSVRSCASRPELAESTIG